MKRLVLFIFLVVMVSGVRAATEYRDFTNAEGKTIRGCIKAYDAGTKTVTIERENKRIAKAPITVFSEADQTYILEWDASKCFLSDTLFRLSCDKNRVDQRKEKEFEDVRYTDGAIEKELMRTTTFERFVFEFELRNMNDVALNDLRIEYVIFYEQSLMAWEETVMEQKTLSDSVPIPVINGRDSKVLTTKPVEIHRDVLGADDNWVSGQERKAGEGEVHGLRARLFMKMPSGQEVMREICFPENLSIDIFRWK